MAGQRSDIEQPSRPRVLVVDDEPDLLEMIADTVVCDIDCRLISARNLSEAKRVLETEPIEVLVADVHLPDGDGTSLLALLKRTRPQASAIVITGEPSVERAISALRGGAVDFVLKPFAANDLKQRLWTALRRQALVAKNERRLAKLRRAVHHLNAARKVVSRKVDLLCNDLISAYGELSRQLDGVRTQASFKQYLADVKDLEQLLCHTMDFLMRQTGYCNIAIFLAGPQDQPQVKFQLGAYMKYTIAGDEALVGAMCENLVTLTVQQSTLRLGGDSSREHLSTLELDYLADQEIVSVSCTYLGEVLAVVTMFRHVEQGFCEADVACLNMVSPLFALALAALVRGSEDPEETPEGGGLDELPPGHGPDTAGDWWKTGKEPPF